MNKKYIDFVPTQKKQADLAVDEKMGATVVRRVSPVASGQARSVSATAERRAKPMVKTAADTPAVKAAAGRPVAKVAAGRPAVSMQPKRPLGQMRKITQRTTSVKLGVIEDLGDRNTDDNTTGKPVEKYVEKSVRQSVKSTTYQSKTYNVPKTPFINQARVEKRPLSKNVYSKKVVVPKEEPKGPVTIIEKPEKDAKVSLVVAVILTIILGAAAGTVAFLLLPK